MIQPIRRNGEPQDGVFFCGFLLNSQQKRLLFRGNRVPLTPKEFDLLTALVSRRGSPCTRDELISVLWPHKDISDYTLSQTVHRLRRALSKRNADEIYIRTVAGCGYEFVAPVEPITDSNRLVRAIALLNGGAAADLPRAIDLFRHMLDEEPQCAPALVGLAFAYLTGAEWTVLDSVIAYRNARRLIERALEISLVTDEAG